MELNGHSLFFAEVLHETGRHHEGHVVYCNRCGGYYWKRALALLERCGARQGLSGGMSDQLTRIRKGLFPSPAPRHKHLVLCRSSRLSGPHAALVQEQLEELTGVSFSGSRQPLHRVTVKRPDIRLQEFPMARDLASCVREQVLKAYGLTDDLLQRLVVRQEELQTKKKEKTMVLLNEESDEDL